MSDIHFNGARPLPNVPNGIEDKPVSDPSSESDTNDGALGAIGGGVGRAAGNAAREAIRRLQQQGHEGASTLSPEQNSELRERIQDGLEANPHEGAHRGNHNEAPRSPTDPSHCVCPPPGNGGGFRLR